MNQESVIASDFPRPGMAPQSRVFHIHNGGPGRAATRSVELRFNYDTREWSGTVEIRRNRKKWHEPKKLSARQIEAAKALLPPEEIAHLTREAMLRRFG